MKRRKWVGSFVCQFCPNDESINHLSFTCPMAAYMWSTISTVLGVFLDLPVLLSIFGGLPKFFLLVLICTLSELLLFAGLFGKLEIMLALKASLFPLHWD
jgi:hypothetical protein